ncbi:hypothetical protein CAPTEDRAFT_215421 [Capitella teleta]|uniref:Uncharacterized protein n=1 Tax=Capitella teleta TaxID=283909 RepID=R7VF23_CAPTE|nr:hypothetical protein CAPTEDRAFT_215421 [Capitella teleta]|eukprot:ELU17162.1 hypothetical protein CAPTEDRAFT_215421 [Capitella teleta]
MKIKAKKDSAKEKKERKKTGGRTAVVMGTMSQTIANLLPQQMNPGIADASEVSADEDGAGEPEGATASTSAAAAPPVNEEDDDEVNRMEDGAEQIPDAEQEPEINIVIGPDEQMHQRDDEPPRNAPVRRRPRPPHTGRADETESIYKAVIVVMVERVCSVSENPFDAPGSFNCLDLLDIFNDFDIVHALNQPATTFKN